MSRIGNQLQLSSDLKRSSVILHDLNQVHVVSVDLEDDAVDPDSQTNFLAIIKLNRQYRSLLFGSFQEMHNAIEFILTCQNYSANRFDQYKYLYKLNLKCRAGETYLVQNRLSGEKFIAKIISKTETKSQLDLVRNEIQVLKACRGLKSVMSLVDVIEDSS